MNEKFWDILAFCHQVSMLMVCEIRKRASNQSTETASCAIAKFLEIENCEESSNGWMLLSTLNLLAAGDATLVQVINTVVSRFFALFLFCGSVGHVGGVGSLNAGSLSVLVLRSAGNVREGGE